MPTNKRTAMMTLCNKFMKALEEFTKEFDIAFSLGKTDFSIDPINLEKMKIKVEFPIKERFIDEIKAGIDRSQVRLDSYKDDVKVTVK